MNKLYTLICVFSLSLVFPNSKHSVGKSIKFVENKGQVHDQNYEPRPDVLFSVSLNSMTCHLKREGVIYQLTKVESWRAADKYQRSMGKAELIPDKTAIYRLEVNWLGANKSILVETSKADKDYSNYYLAACPNGVTNVKSYNGIFYRNIYDGIDLHYYSIDGNLKCDYILKPFADYKKIRLQIDGAKKISINADGELVFVTSLGEISEGKPIIYQSGKKLEGHWSLKNNVVSFEIEDYDRSKELIIDPITRVWGTFYGGSNTEIPRESKTDQSGNVFITGQTSSPTTTLIATTGSHQSVASNPDEAFLAKYDLNGNLLWGTYYGGNIGDISEDCCIDVNGDIYISGYTNSSFGIATPGSHKSAFVGSTGFYDAFLAKFNTNGIRIWGTYYGGAGTTDYSRGCTTDQNGNVYMCGQTDTQTGTVIATPGSHQSSYGGSFADAFLVKFDSTGVRLWGTYYGGTGVDAGYHCDADPAGNIIIIGQTDSPTSTLVASPGSHQTAFSSQLDGFVAKFNSNGVRQWGTYYGGTGAEWAYGSATDALGNVYLCGVTTTSVGSSIAAGGFQNAFGGTQDGFLVKFSPTGVRLWGTYYGGTHTEEVYRCCTDVSNNVYLTGTSGSSVTPVIATYGNYQSSYGGNMDAFLVKFNSSGFRQWGTYYGGANGDYGYSCCISNLGDIYMYGLTYDIGSGNIIASSGAQQNYNASPGGRDVFLVRFNECNAPPSPVNTTPTVNLSVCNGFTTSLSASGNGTVSWFNTPVGGAAIATGSIFSTPTLTTGTSSTAYAYYAENTNTCSPSASRTQIIVTVYPSPQITFFGNLSLCPGQSTTITAFGANTYSWNTGATTSSLSCSTPSSSITYSVLGTSVMGCKSNIPITVTVNPTPTINISSAINPLCVGQAATLTASGASTYTWNTGPTTNTISINPVSTTVYSVIGKSSANCSNTTAITITVNPNPIVTAISPSVAICSGNNGCLSASGANTYIWAGPCGFSSTQQNPCFPFNLACTCNYSVIGTDMNGCKSTATVCISVLPNPTVTTSTSNTLICAGQTAILTSNGANTYSWSTSTTGSVVVISPTVSTTYTVTGIDLNGCTNIASITQSVSSCVGVTEFSNSNETNIFPNPTSGQFTLLLNNVKEKMDIKVVNAIGQIVLRKHISSTDRINLNISDQASGVYFIEVSADGERYRTKIVKE